MFTQYMLCQLECTECSTKSIQYNIEEQHGSYIIAIILSEATKNMHSTNILIALAITSINWCVLIAKGSLVPRPLPAFQCCTLKNGKAWYAIASARA